MRQTSRLQGWRRCLWRSMTSMVILRRNPSAKSGHLQSIAGVCASPTVVLVRFGQWPLFLFSSSNLALQAWRERASGASGERRARLSRAHNPTQRNATRLASAWQLVLVLFAVPWRSWKGERHVFAGLCHCSWLCEEEGEAGGQLSVIGLLSTCSALL
jgi:hypothetical protein